MAWVIILSLGTANYGNTFDCGVTGTLAEPFGCKALRAQGRFGGCSPQTAAYVSNFSGRFPLPFLAKQTLAKVHALLTLLSKDSLGGKPKKNTEFNFTALEGDCFSGKWVAAGR